MPKEWIKEIPNWEEQYLAMDVNLSIREKELLGASGNSLDYFSVKGAEDVDFRADNIRNFESLEKNSIDLYSSMKSIYLQDRENKIRNSIEDEDEWGNLDN